MEVISCSLDFTLDAQGDEASCLAQFEAARKDIAALLKEKHPNIEFSGVNEPVEPDDLQRSYGGQD